MYSLVAPHPVSPDLLCLGLGMVPQMFLCWGELSGDPLYAPVGPGCIWWRHTSYSTTHGTKTQPTATAQPIAHPMAAFSGFYESHKPPPSGNARGIVLAHCNGHRNSQQSGFILHRRTVCCRPGGRRGNTERVVARWRRLVASTKALDLLHRAMCAVSHHCTAMKPPMEVHLFVAATYFDCCNRS